MDNKLKGIIFLMLSTVFYSLYGVFFRFIAIDFGVFSQALARNLFIIVIISVYLAFTRSWKKVEKEDYKWFLAMTSFGFLAGLTYFIAVNNLTIATTLFVLYASNTLGGYILGSLLFKEKMTKLKVISLLICLLGLLVMFYSGLEQSKPIFMIAAILCGFGAIGWSIFSKKISLKYSFEQILFIDSVLPIIGSLILMFLFKDPFVAFSFSLSWLALMIYSVVAVGGVFLTIVGFRYVSAQSGTLLMLLEPVFGIIVGWLFFKESLGLLSLVGGTMILIGACLPIIKEI